MKLMTLNLNFYADKHGVWEKRRALIAKVLRRESPDIVAFQAACQPKNPNTKSQAAELAEESGINYAAMLFKGYNETSSAFSGQAFLAKVPAQSVSEVPLKLSPENRDDRYSRFVYIANFNTSFGSLTVCNCHFSWQEEQNAANVEEALAGLDLNQKPLLLMGDFNATPDKAPVELLMRKGLIDLWPLKHIHEYGATFESNLPKMRIDYILANRLSAPYVRNIYIVREELEDENIRLSDHLGLIVVLEG
jgi:endonuclease/exonuclease/phosphatase family metal-dependent hydrolase